MGYSFATPCKSKKALKEMMGFLDEHYRAWDKIIEPFKDDLTAGRGIMPMVTFETRLRGPATEGAYDHGATRIVFDYGAGFSDGERYWMYNLCYWMAQRVGRRRPFKKKAPDCGAVPYVVYDGYEAWPVLEKSEFGDKVGDSEWIVEDGFRGMVSLIEWEKKASEKTALEQGLEMAKELLDYLAGRRKTSEIVDKAIQTELARLTELWGSR
jgi:hypothetical protein